MAMMSASVIARPLAAVFFTKRSFISVAPASVKVMNSILCGSVPSANILAPRSVIHSVFPVPAPALTLQ